MPRSWTARQSVFRRLTLRPRRYDLDQAHAGLVSTITDLIDSLTMARYLPSRYEIDTDERVSERALAGLLQSSILKRFESCWAACLSTVSMMMGVHEAFLTAWDSGGWSRLRDALRIAARGELDASGNCLLVGKRKLRRTLRLDQPATILPEYPANMLRRTETPLARLHGLLSTLNPATDPKLMLLRRILEESRADKIAVVASFADTIRYLDENLPQVIGDRERIAVIGVETNPDPRTAALARFCPDTVVRPGYEPPDGEVNMLLSTDVLSEGQNLQQAAAVISYDMPWNPQRVIQRNGRIIPSQGART